MGSTVSRIPSSGIPFTDSQGRINPIWYEFFRSFISSTVETSSVTGSNLGKNVVAGAGLLETPDDDSPNDLVLAVGAGNGLIVNANDVNVDISNQSYAAASPDDELLISVVSDNNSIRKTKVSDLISTPASVGGSDTQIQYNDSGEFGGDSGFTTDGAGNVVIDNSLQVEGITFTGGAVETIHFDGTSGSTVPRIQTDGGGGYSFYAGAVSSQDVIQYFNPTGSDRIRFTLGTSSTITLGREDASGNGMNITGRIPLRRCMHENVTANATQAQGDSALTGDYCNIITVATDNDSVTLPAALRSRLCTVRNAGANILQVYPASGDDLGFGTNVSTKIRPGAHFTWFAIDTTTWHQMDGLLRHTVVSGITASTTQTQGQQPLTADVNEISVVSNANDTVTLPSAPAYSRTITVINNGANTLQIFPASGDNLGAGVDTSTTLASGSNVRYTNYNNTNWENV